MRKSLFQAAGSAKGFPLYDIQKVRENQLAVSKEKGGQSLRHTEKRSVLREIFVLFLQGKSKFSSFKKYLQYKFVLYIRKIRKNL